MKNIKKIFVIFTLIFLNLNIFSQTVLAWDLKITTTSQESLSNQDKVITRQDAFNFIWDYILYDVPKSSTYIVLNFTDVKNNTKLYKSLQKMVYIDVLPNDKLKINKDKYINAYTFYKIIEDITWASLITQKNTSVLSSRNTTIWDLYLVNDFISRLKDSQSQNINSDLNNVISSQEEYEKYQILFDVYSTILSNHYDKANLKTSDLISWAIEWMASSTWDKYTTYFPPADAKDFNEHLSWEFEWIWAYIEMQTAWVLKIISPLDWSPAKAAWLKAWDVITKVDWKEITPEITLDVAVSYIKWQAWTKVKLTVLRDGKTFDVEITRAKVTIKDVEYKKINNETFYIQIKVFGDNVFTQFSESLQALNKETWIKKVVFDLRNNPGWYLDKVADMLSMFVDKWNPVAIVDSQDWENIYASVWYKTLDLNNYKVYILQNSWSASASEIMIWTLKDYFPDITLVWEKTYWKWSVQTIKSYIDWSSFKYTIAKWFTWKTKTWIDKVWIKPDIELKQDETKPTEDTQLNYILTK